MKFGSLEFVWIVLLVPLLVSFYIWGYKRKRFLLDRFIERSLQDRLLGNVSFTKQKIKIATVVVSILFLCLALMRPQWGFHWEEIKRDGVDIIIALDVSKSMLATDVSPNRLERAKREIRDLLKIIQGDRVGLIAFAGTSFLQVPLTLDYGAIQIFLDDLDTDLIPTPGTAIADAINKSVESFDQKDKQSRVLILITDGEDHEGDPIAASEEAKKQSVKIYSIGIGGEEGAPIPDAGGGFKKDSKGEMILTSLDEKSLQKIALNTGGSYVRSVTGDLDLEQIYRDITTKVESKELKSGKRKRFEERFQWPLLVAIFLLMFEILYVDRKKRRSIFPFFIFLFLTINTASASFFSGAEKEAERAYDSGNFDTAITNFLDAKITNPNDSRLKFNLANSYYKKGDYEKAANLFQDSAMYGEKSLSAKSYYNLGNVAYQTGKLQEAVEMYKKTLEINPDDQDAKYNLEFVREEIKRRLEEQKKRQEQQQQEQQQQDKQQGQDKQENGQDNQDNKEQQDKKDQQEDQQEDQQKEQRVGDKEENKGENGSENKKMVMSEEEAKRWLDGLQEDRKKFLKGQMKGKRGYSVEKDW